MQTIYNVDIGYYERYEEINVYQGIERNRVISKCVFLADDIKIEL